MFKRLAIHVTDHSLGTLAGRVSTRLSVATVMDKFDRQHLIVVYLHTQPCCQQTS